MNKLKYAVTGASGYVGSHVVKYLQSKGLIVYEMGRVCHSQNQDHFISYQLDEKKDYPELQKVDVLIHCAYDFNAESEKENNQINVQGSLHLFQQARQHGVKKIIFISSMFAFPGVCSIYGKTKLKIEELSRDLDVIIVRPGLIYSLKPRGIMGAMNKIIQISLIVPLIGRGRQIFYPCHVADLGELLYQLTQSVVTIRIPIVAAAQQPLMFKEIIKILAEAHSKKVLLLPFPYVFIYSGLRLAEIIGLKIGLRSDSVVSMKHYSPQVDFSATNSLNIPFRLMTPKRFSQES